MVIEKINNFSNFINFLNSTQLSILSIIEHIDESDIDYNKSIFSQYDEHLSLYIVAKNDKCCPFWINFGHNKIYFCWDKSGDIYDEDLEINVNIEEIKEYLIEFLKTDVVESKYYIDGDLVKIVYSYFLNVNGKQEEFKHGTYERFIWFWEKKKIKKVKYSFWFK